MSDWIGWLRERAASGADCVLVTVAHVEGSTPRETGTRMVVTADDAFATIGGGHLEYKATAMARELLAEPGAGPRLHRFPLGPELGQCCGGSTTVLLEPVAARESRSDWLEALARLAERATPGVLVSASDRPQHMVVSAEEVAGEIGGPELSARIVALARERLGAPGGARLVDLETPQGDGGEPMTVLLAPLEVPDLDLVVFGAGHVGRALVAMMAALPCRIRWIDGRDGVFPEDLPANVRAEVSDDLEGDVDDAPAGSYYLVMTHSHALDLVITERILKRGDFRYFGLIGSRSKRARFERRLRQRGITPETLARMTCPIGLAGLSGKHPAEIAIATAAQILELRAQAPAAAGAAPGARAVLA
jgi:xanthine dehydrogenase accessory factor